MAIKCTICDKEVADEKALQQHKEAKHPETIKKPFFTVKNNKTIRNGVIVFIILILFFVGIYYFWHQTTQEQVVIANITATSLNKIPKAATHWHPHLTIIINNQTYPIPNGIGMTIGNVIDTEYGMDKGMSPTHTHSADGVIHLENLNPQARPETFALGYLFYVWDKEFSKECIFDYCTNNGTLIMTVNGIENMEFENYIMQDKDEILIRYTSFENAVNDTNNITQNSS